MQSLLLQSSSTSPLGTWGAIAVGVVTIVYVAFIRPMRKKKDPLEKSPADHGLSRQRGVEREMSNLLVELSEMARQMTAQLDTRAARLEALIREADEKIAALQAANGAYPGTGGNQVMVEAKVLESHAVPMPDRPGHVAMIEDAPPKLDPRHAEVYGLADEGQSAQEIARQTGRPRGEIELILALRGR
jgi:hypothetical protein